MDYQKTWMGNEFQYAAMLRDNVKFTTPNFDPKIAIVKSKVMK